MEVVLKSSWDFILRKKEDYINHAWNNYGIRIRFRPE